MTRGAERTEDGGARRCTHVETGEIGKREAAISAAAIGVVVATVAWFLAPFVLDREIVVERDALSSILPIRVFLARALQEGSWPMWNPAPVLGKPFLPEWQTGLFYAPSALLAIPPVSRGFNLFFVFHYAWTAVGGFLLLRALGTTRLAAALGALVWSLGGPLASLGHLLNHLMAIAWLPWVLWGWVRPRGVRTKIAASAVMLAAALLTGSPEMALLISGLLILIALDTRALLVPPIAALLAAAQLIPVWLYLGLTHRGAHGLASEDVLAYSTPLARLSEVVVAGPDVPGAFLPSLYIGPVPVLLALAALLFLPSLVRLLSLLLLIVLVGLSLGGNAGLLPLLHEYLPGVDLLRYPEKLFVGVHALIALGAAWGLAQISARLPARLGPLVAMVLVVLSVADIARVNRDLLFTMPPSEVFEPPAIARTMLESGDRRYYANSTGAPKAESTLDAARIDQALLYAATGELYGLENVNTPASLNLIEHERLHRALEQLLQPQALATLHALGTRFVTSYPEIRGPDIRQIDVPSDPARLYALGEDARRAFIAQRVGIAPDAQAALHQFVHADTPLGTAVIEGIGVHEVAYEAPKRSDIAWKADNYDALALDVSLDAPGLLVVNDTFVEGWRATVDGMPASIERVNGLVRGVWLGSGEHHVTMRYRPPGLPLGTALSLATLVALCLATYRAGQYRTLRSQP